MQGIRLVVPVKTFTEAKSRLKVPERSRVARQLFRHTLGVSLQCVRPSQLTVLTADDEAKRAARRHKVHTLDDEGISLNDSLEIALLALRRSFPNDTVAVMVADLPRLTAAVLSRALMEAVRSDQARLVVDQHGTGTTFLSLPPEVQLTMSFGRDSARRFIHGGAVPMLFPPPAIAHDLDVLSDLEALSDLKSYDHHGQGLTWLLRR